MAERFDEITPKIRTFIDKQHMFFVATAPREGRVNVSPKGYKDTFKVIDAHTFAYLELFGSGIETKAHLGDDPRITIMFCSFGRTAKILRLYGTGTVVVPADPNCPDLIGRFGPHPGVRSIIVVELDRISDSCGYGVPTMTAASERDLLNRWATRDDVRARRRTRSASARASIDGVPALDPAETDPSRVSSTR